MNLYDFSVKTINGEEISLQNFKGQTALVVNTASKCGFTEQYQDLEILYEKYKNEGFVVLGFPCNQFGGQEPGSEQEIKAFCDANYHITFPLFAKIDVNGENAAPLYTWLKEGHPFGGFNLEHPLGKVLDEKLFDEDKNYALSSDIKWNFTKFAVDRAGACVKRFEPTCDMDEVEDFIKTLL